MNGVLRIKQITQLQRDKLAKAGYLDGEKKVYIASKNKKGRGKTYYTLDSLAKIAETL